MLLVHGGGAQMINWPDGFCAEPVGRGVQLIRFDNRDTGLSSHFPDAPVPDLQAALASDFSSASYTLSRHGGRRRPWDAVAASESGGNWSTNTGNGYSGGLQCG